MVLLNHTQMSRAIQIYGTQWCRWRHYQFGHQDCLWRGGPGGNFIKRPFVQVALYVEAVLHSFALPHRQFCGSLCFDRRQLAGETKRANWYVSTGGGLLGMHNYYMVTPEGNLIINLFGGCWCCVQIYMIWPNSINREIQRARARRLINYIVKLWCLETLDE